MRTTRPLLAALACTALLAPARADEASHRYELGESVTIWLAKVGPYHNPQESYSYYSLPFCAPTEPLRPQTKFSGIGELLEGTEWTNSDLRVHFGVDVPSTAYCSMTLSDTTANFLDFAIANHYWYQMYLDELPIWGLVGEIVKGEDALRHLIEHGETFTEEAQILGHNTDAVKSVSLEDAIKYRDSAFLFTHRRFDIAYNGDRIIEVNLTSDAPQLVEPGKLFDLSYSVHWTPVDRPFASRFQRYLDSTFFEHQIHWFSLFNSFMMVVFLVGLVALILLRTVRNDFARYMREEEDLDGIERGVGEDSGWKQVHGDVFRPPPNLEIFSALLGSGAQLVLMSAVVILTALAGTLYVDRGATTTASLVAYAITSIFAGYVSGAFYRGQFFPQPAPEWKFVMFLTASLLPSLAGLVLLSLNVIAVSYNTINAISFGTLLFMFGVWLVISLPLTIAGTLLGRRGHIKDVIPRRVNLYPRPLPEKPWFQSPLTVALASGLLPFGSIFIEAYFVFTSFWGYKFYYVYGFMLLVFFMLAVVTACVCIVGTYILLNAEDYRWQWTAFFSGGSVAVYTFLYAMFYFVVKTHMHGFLQTAFYFGYSLLGCLMLGIATGFIGYFAATLFVRRIYANIKAD